MWRNQLNKTSLRAEVLRHVLVVVEMVLGEVGEHTHVEADAVQATLLQCVGRCLHDDCLHASVGQLPQPNGDLDGARGRQGLSPWAHPFLVGETKGPDRRSRAATTQEMAHEGSRRSLSVGTGDADHEHPLVGRPHHGAGGDRPRLPTIVHPKLRDIDVDETFDNGSHSPSGRRVRYEIVRVHPSALPCEEQIPRPGLSRVLTDPQNADVPRAAELP